MMMQPFSRREGRTLSSVILFRYSPRFLVTDQKKYRTHDTEHSDRCEDRRCKKTERSCQAESPGRGFTSKNLETLHSDGPAERSECLPSQLTVTSNSGAVPSALLLGRKYVLSPPVLSAQTVRFHVVPHPRLLIRPSSSG